MGMLVRILLAAAIKDPTQTDFNEHVNYWLKVFQAWLDQEV